MRGIAGRMGVVGMRGGHGSVESSDRGTELVQTVALVQ